MRDNIKPGATLPDFELPDHTGTKRRLSFLQGDDPMVLTLHRGREALHGYPQSAVAKLQCDEADAPVFRPE